MLRKIGLVFLCLWLLAAGGVYADGNICYTTHAGHCYTDVEWKAGWFWANNPPSLQSCIAYHSQFPMGDFWGMCNHINLPDDMSVAQPGNGASASSGQSLHPDYAVTLNTSYGSGQCNLPPDGVEDDYSYDTSSCQTDF